MSKLNELNNLLFEQMKKITDTNLSDEALKLELERSKAVSMLAGNIVNNAKIALEGAKLGVGYQSFNALPEMFEPTKNNAAYLEQKTKEKYNKIEEE